MSLTPCHDPPVESEKLRVLVPLGETLSNKVTTVFITTFTFGHIPWWTGTLRQSIRKNRVEKGEFGKRL